MLTGGMGIAGVEGGMGGGWRRLDRRGIDGIRGKEGNWGKEGGHREERGGGGVGDCGFYAVWGAYMGHVGGSVSVYGRLMQCMSGWRRKGRRMRGLGGE